jgi:hypothetical protein
MIRAILAIYAMTPAPTLPTGGTPAACVSPIHHEPTRYSRGNELRQ